MENEVLVRRANVVLRIKESQVDRYRAQGYAVIDDNGNVVAETTKPTLSSLQQLHEQDLKKIAALEARIKELEAGQPEAQVAASKRGRPKKEV